MNKMKTKEFLKLLLLGEIAVIFVVAIAFLISLIPGMEPDPITRTDIFVMLSSPFPAALLVLLLKKLSDWLDI